jgi:hypothetical protein
VSQSELATSNNATDAHCDNALANTSCIANADPTHLYEEGPQLCLHLSLLDTGRKGLPNEEQEGNEALNWESTGRSQGGGPLP